MKTSIQLAHSDRRAALAEEAGKFADPMLCEDMETNRIERMLQTLTNDEQLLAVFAPIESAVRQTWLRQSMCESKARYDKRGACTMLNAFAKKRGRHGRPENLRAYPCPFCAGWHLTKAVGEMLEPSHAGHLSLMPENPNPFCSSLVC